MEIPVPGIIELVLVELDSLPATPAPDTGGGDIGGSDVCLKVCLPFDGLNLSVESPFLWGIGA